MRSVSIDEIHFFDAFGRDADFHDLVPLAYWLDLETGDIIWVFEEDDDAGTIADLEPEENRDAREQVEKEPDRYLLIPGLSHGEHHDILREFLYSDWTNDNELLFRVRDAYSGSIGGWIKQIDDRQIIHAYYDYRDVKIREMAEEFLSDHNIKPLWHF